MFNKMLTGKISASLIKRVLPNIFDKMQSLIELRYHQDACLILVQSAKGQHTLFTVVGLYAILIGTFFINPR
jgi:hypothetical protein